MKIAYSNAYFAPYFIDYFPFFGYEEQGQTGTAVTLSSIHKGLFLRIYGKCLICQKDQAKFQLNLVKMISINEI